MESASEAAIRQAGPAVPKKAWRDSQGSLPKTGPNTYLDEKSTEL
ncbi:hypothetical protein [Bradyrhizobium sp.]